MYSDYCCFCGHFLQDRHLQRKEREMLCYKPSEISKTWEKAYKSWKQSIKDSSETSVAHASDSERGA